MAALNVTQADVSAVANGFDACVRFPFQVEKISCWNGSFLQIDPFVFFGKSVRVGETLTFAGDDDPALTYVYEAKVVAVHVGSVEDGIETSLLLRQDGSDPDYVTISNLTVLEVLE